MGNFHELTVEGMRSAKDEMLVIRHFTKYVGIEKVVAIKELDKVEISYDPQMISLHEPINSLIESLPFKVKKEDY